MISHVNGRASTARKQVPGPRQLPLVGWRGQYLQFMRDPIGYTRTLRETYGNLCGVVGFTEGQVGSLCAVGPEFNRQVWSNPDLFHNTQVSMAKDTSSALWRLGDGLISMNGDEHKQQRRLIMPAFHKKRIENYVGDVGRITAQALDGWQVGQVVNIAREMRKVTLPIAAKTLFGLDELDKAQYVSGMFERWLHLNISATVLPVAHPWLPYGQLLALSHELETEIRAIIAQRRAEPSEGADVLSMLVHARDEQGRGLTDDELIGQINILFVASHDTSSDALTWTLFLLAQHPEIMQDVLDELEGELHGAPPGITQLGNLPLLERVIKESMRLLPPGTYSTRRSTDAFDMGPYHFARGTTVMLSIYLTHHMPDLYPEPERFWPDRWLQIDPSPYEYVPFGAGSRMCIGANFAWMEMKITLATVLQRYRLSLVPNARIDRKELVTLTPKHGMPMRIHKQDRCFARTTVRGNIHEMVNL